MTTGHRPGATAVRFYAVYRSEVSALGRLVARLTVEGDRITGRIAPELAPHREQLRREIGAHAAGAFAEMSLRVGVGGVAYFVVPTADPAMPPPALHPDAVAFIRTMHRSPDDDAPRLVFADWLDDHGEHERAALIRRMVRVPSYRFFWRQSRTAHRPKHEHKEPVNAIRGLKPKLSALCREEWGARRGVEQVVIRRGFAEAVTMPAHVFLATAGDLFARHPFREVHLSDLQPRASLVQSGTVEASLRPDEPVWDQWPAVLFPERSAGEFVRYSGWYDAMADLSRRAAGYGRRAAGVIVEPPPLPSRPGFVPDPLWRMGGPRLHVAEFAPDADEG